ncbi:hypothetical protein [Pantoea wallisii]|uniref:hypothetical protein n=1 Tax=Pantoea wallisii TaxID=1076551 RepID=UPI001ABF18D9|nr:hypothetical protein [Pantoea wallisii]
MAEHIDMSMAKRREACNIFIIVERQTPTNCQHRMSQQSLLKIIDVSPIWGYHIPKLGVGKKHARAIY